MTSRPVDGMLNDAWRRAGNWWLWLGEAMKNAEVPLTRPRTALIEPSLKPSRRRRTTPDGVRAGGWRGAEGAFICRDEGIGRRALLVAALPLPGNAARRRAHEAGAGVRGTSGTAEIEIRTAADAVRGVK
jgi:hypothetical protein